MLPWILLFGTTDCNVRGEEVDNAAQVYASAQDKIKTGQQKDALLQLNALLRTSPWFAQAHWAIAQVEESRGNLLNAYVAYKHYLRSSTNADDRAAMRRRMTELEGKLPELATYAQGEQAARAKNWEETAKLMQQVIEQKPKFALSYRLLGIAHSSLGSVNEAADAYAKYLDADPDAPERTELEDFLNDFRSQQNRNAQ